MKFIMPFDHPGDIRYYSVGSFQTIPPAPGKVFSPCEIHLNKENIIRSYKPIFMI